MPDHTAGARVAAGVSLGWRRMLLGGLLVALVALLVASEASHAVFQRALDAVERAATLHPGWAALLFVIFNALAAMLAFVSSWVAVPFAVYTWGTSRALILLFVGWLLGGVASYTIGRVLGRPVVRWLGFTPLLERYEARVSHRTPFGLVLLLQLALPSEVPGYLFGLGRYPALRYLAALSLAELPFALGTVYLASGVVERRTAVVLGVGLGLVLASAAAVYGLRRRLARDRRGTATGGGGEGHV